MRGEHLDGIDEIDMGEGSSPHARGTPNQLLPLLTAQGIIPACAGNTSDFVAMQRHVTDHPRMRGEHNGFRSVI